jgi:ferredoxin
MFLHRLTTQRLNPRRIGAAVSKRWHGPKTAADAPTISVSYLQPDGETKIVSARVGENFLQVAHRNEIDLEGACEGVCACSTCHGIFPMDFFDQLPEASEDEEDMLDMAPGLTETSRLCCQVIAEKYMDGMTITMPRATRK